MKIKKIKDVMKILRDLEKHTGDDLLHIELFSDKSGSIKNLDRETLIMFNNFDELKEHIKLYKNL